MSITDKLKKVDDNFTVNMYDNGFMVEIGGQDEADDWTRAKVVVNSVEELVELIKEVSNLPRNS